MGELSLLDICVVSVDSRRAIGGLATYERWLVKSLCRNNLAAVALYDRELASQLDYGRGGATGFDVGTTIDGVTTHLVGPRRGSIRLLRRLHHLTSRPGLRTLAPVLYSAAYGPAMERAVPGRVDVVHYVGAGWDLLGFTAMKVARRRGAAFTIWPAVHPGTWGDAPLDIDLYDQADAVFCQSDHELEHLADRGVARHRLVRAWLAPASEATGDGARFRGRHGLGERPIVLFIARKTVSKGYHALREAMATVTASVPGACLVAIGPDAEPPYPPVTAGALLDLGVASEADKADALAACNLLCVPSSAESFGIVYVEAWGYGKPVIGGPAPAVRELVEGANGGVVVEQTAEAVAAAVVRRLEDVGRSKQLGENGRQQVLKRYNWNSVRDLHLDVFRRVIAQRKS